MLRKRLDGSPSARAASLSAAVPGTAGPCGPSTAHARSAAIKVLLVDDSDDLRLLVARALHRRGHQVDAFADAESAWEACQQTAYPLIILDWMLPGMDGLELCRRIRRLPWGDSALVLVMTANDQPEHLQAVLEAGADDYLAKPFDLRLLDVRLTIAERQVEVLAARKRAEEALREQALHDPLTGLPNRRLLRDRLDQALLAAARDGRAVGLLLLDLDGFKAVNDRLGHAAGDELLRQVARRLRATLRRPDTAARIGGDEFALLLPAIGSLSGARQVARRMAQALSEPFLVEGQRVRISGSIGVAVSPEHGRDADTLLRHADAAMYAAKRARGGYAIYGEPGPDQQPGLPRSAPGDAT